MKSACRSITLWMLILYSHPLWSQQIRPDSLNAIYITEKINFDGRLDDAIWRMAAGTDNFTQRELAFGKPASEKTKVAIVYDKLALYIGVWCYMKKANQVSAKYMQRDFAYEEDDNFQIALSPFSDRRNGYLFIINP